MGDRIATLLGLAEGIKNTGNELQSIGAKLHTFADALNTEANAIAEERLKLKRDLAAALAAAEKARNASNNIDICVGIRTGNNGPVFRKLNCCTGCEGDADGGAEDNNGWGGSGGVKSQVAKSGGGSKAGSVVSRKSGGGGAMMTGAAGSHLSSSHATQK